ncbi:uncharacterized protein LOC117334077 [Pecten maximus]|uniref:uncharacterized protein LOC117334077 n=1 Tax=Pecten maximus TaxID=6579 RepID=UPI0014584DC2|nr:uncharacterized protein LOC117334077 [Pecten maximus]
MTGRYVSFFQRIRKIREENFSPTSNEAGIMGINCSTNVAGYDQKKIRQIHLHMERKLMDIFSPNSPEKWSLLQKALSHYLESEQLYGKDVNTFAHICRSLMTKKIISYGDYDKLYEAVHNIDDNAAKIISSTTASVRAVRLEGKKDTVTALPITGAYCTKFSSKIEEDTKEGNYVVQRMVALPDDRVIVLDRDNIKLKLFSSTYHFLHSVGLGGVPVGLTVVNASSVAVSDETTNCITLYAIQDNTIQTSTSLQCGMDNGYLLDIAYSKQHFICLKWDFANRIRTVERVSMTGHRQTVVQIQDWCDIGYHIIAMDNCYYTTECASDQVRCMTYDGKQLWKKRTPLGPMGMTTVNRTLCVVSLTKGVVSQLSLDGTIYGHNILQNVTKPYIYCICYQNLRKRLLVSCSEREAPIMVFDITSTEQNCE